MRYLSVCSGIEAATVAWHPLGWTPVAFSEIEPFPAAVLAHHYPNVPNYGDMTKHKEWPLGPGAIDLLVGGTPCQSFSVAGLRKGISDPRGGLMLTYLEIAQRLRPRWIVWENVPGVLSSGGGRDFGSFLGALGELGYGWAYRVLDAQWVRTQRHPRAVPQRRRRVFVVGCLGDASRAAQVLFERESVQRDSAPCRTQGQGVAADAEAGIARCVTTGEGKRQDWETCTLVSCLETTCHDYSRADGFTMVGAVLQPVGFCWQNNDLGLKQDSVTAALRSSAGSSGFHEMNHPVVVHQPVAVDLYNQAIDGDCAATLTEACGGTNTSGPKVMAHAFYSTDGTHGVNQHPEVSPTVRTGSGLGIPSPPAVALQNAIGFDGFQSDNPKATHQATIEGTGPLIRGRPHCVATQMTVRRLTPRECERLQAFPDDYTLIPWRKKPAAECPDGPRYKALGNSMAVNCMAWIGERIAAIEANNGAIAAPPLPNRIDGRPRQRSSTNGGE